MTSTMRFDRWQNSLGQPYGTVLQVKSVTKTDIFSTTSFSFVDITGFSVSITPFSATSKILVMVDGYAGSGGSGAVRTLLLRNSTPISAGDAAGSRVSVSSEGYSSSTNHPTPIAVSFLDSPATTSAITYKVQLSANSAGQTVALNRSASDGDFNFIGRYASSITLMEIAQ
jgi:hypothetical protein